MDIKQYEIFLNNNNLPCVRVIREFDSEIAQELQNYTPKYICAKLDIMRKLFQMQDYESEHIYVIASDSDGHISGIYLMGIGNQAEVNLNTRNMFIFLLLVGAFSCLVVHNHPNDNLKASQDDKVCSFTYAASLKTFQIKYEGSYIISKTGFSNCDTGEITTWKELDGNEPDFSIGEWIIVSEEVN